MVLEPFEEGQGGISSVVEEAVFRVGRIGEGEAAQILRKLGHIWGEGAPPRGS